MYKQRDNEYYPPMTVDPTGSRTVVEPPATLVRKPSDGEAGRGLNSAVDGPAVAAGSRKRGRDIRGLDRFRSVVYGADGFRRLHAMVARNPVIMYPPEGIEAARARLAVRRSPEKERERPQNMQSSGGRRARRDDTSEVADDFFAQFEEREQAENVGPSEGPQSVSPATSALSPVNLASFRRDQELSTTHHKQLDSFLRVIYEFNHVTFVKLPMEDTLQLLSRCGKEAVAHIVEYETQVRLRREARIKELLDLRKDRMELERRRRSADEAEGARLVLAAEMQQAILENDAEEPLPISDPAAEERMEAVKWGGEEVGEDASIEEQPAMSTASYPDTCLSPMVGMGG